MRLIVEPFRADHLRQLISQGVQRAQVNEVSHVPDSYIRPPGLALAVREADLIVLVGGVIPTAPHMGTLWAALSPDAGRYMLALHRGVKRFIDIERRARLEATVAEGFEQGERWLTMLGFEFEGRMPKYGEDGATYLRYGLIR